MPAEDDPGAYLASLNRDGFVVVKNILLRERLPALREAASAATTLARGGQWPHIRTVGKRFPSWPPSTGDSGIWGVQHLMKPDMPGSELFNSLYFSSEILGVVKALLQCEDDDLVMELFNMLVRPESDSALCWHRDDIPPTADANEEMERPGRPGWHA